MTLKEQPQIDADVLRSALKRAETDTWQKEVRAAEERAQKDLVFLTLMFLAFLLLSALAGALWAEYRDFTQQEPLQKVSRTYEGAHTLPKLSRCLKKES